MTQDRQWIANMLRRLGYPEAADDAARELPDSVSEEELVKFGEKHGITRAELMDRMGGSP